MALSTSRIKPCLWFDHEAEEAAKFYTDIFPDSKICHISHYTEAGYEHHHQEAGKVLTVEFTLSGTPFVALNGGSPSNMDFKFNAAVSFQIDCKDQAEVDHYWSRLLEGGGKENSCGWLADRFGLSWQVVPIQLKEFLSRGQEGDDRNRRGSKRAMEAMMGMVKLDIAALTKAYEGEEGGETENKD